VAVAPQRTWRVSEKRRKRMSGAVKLVALFNRAQDVGYGTDPRVNSSYIFNQNLFPTEIVTFSCRQLLSVPLFLNLEENENSIVS